MKGGAVGWTVALDEGANTLRIQADEITNYSAAARLAWNRMPNRKVGRPAGTKVTDRVSVIFRVERPIWEEFLTAERDGLVPDRTAAINSCIRKLLRSLSSQRTAT